MEATPPFRPILRNEQGATLEVVLRCRWRIGGVVLLFKSGWTLLRPFALYYAVNYV